jgi:hypothetical protein
MVYKSKLSGTLTDPKMLSLGDYLPTFTVAGFSINSILLLGGLVISVIALSLSRKKKPAKDTWNAHVFPHGPLQELAPNLWQVHGTLPRAPPRNMTIYRFDQNKLLIHSAVCLNEDKMSDLEDLGQVEIIIVPNRLHRADAAMWKKSFPNAKLICPSFSKKYVEQVVTVDDTCENILPKYGIKCINIQGMGDFNPELLYEVKLQDGVAILTTDIIFNIGPSEATFITRLLGSVSNGVQPIITPLVKWFGIKDVSKFKMWFTETFVQDQVKVVTVAHGNAVYANAKEKMANIIKQL